MFSVVDPLTNKECQAAFVPCCSSVVTSREVSNVTRAKFSDDVDNDGDALRDGQVMESFTTQSEALPVPTASTWSELQNAPAP